VQDTDHSVGGGGGRGPKTGEFVNSLDSNFKELQNPHPQKRYVFCFFPISVIFLLILYEFISTITKLARELYS
jgi:hypothetical protein